jgi:hypothetical protein
MANLHTKQVTEAAVMQNMNYRSEKSVGDKTGVSRETMILEIHNTRSIICCCFPQLQSAASAGTIPPPQNPSGKYDHQNNQTSGQSVTGKNVNSNAMDILLDFTMFQEIMPELSGTITEIEKVAVITNAVFRMLKNNANNKSPDL